MPASPPFKVAFLGFSDFERNALLSYFKLAANRTPSYEHVTTLTDADFLVADADHGPSVQLVLVTERQAETVFVGAQAPLGCTAWMMRPIDALLVMRELDNMAALAAAPARAPAEDAVGTGPRTTVLQTPRQRRHDAPVLTEVVTPSPQAPAPPVLTQQVMPPPAPPPQEAPPPLKPPPTPAPASMARAAAPAPPPQRQPLPPSTPPRALLVDDSQIALRFLESRLERFGVQCDCATHSEQALELLAQHKHELVFLDVELGAASAQDGLALCRHIKQSALSVNTVVLMVSAHHSELDRVRGALAGCDGYLAKPLDDRELQRLLQRQGVKLVPRAVPGATPA